MTALHDSGCAITTMKTRTFLRMPGSNINLLQQPKSPIMIQSCTGEMTPSKGVANVNLQFIGENGNIICIDHKVIISDHIDYDLILGRDITGSSLKMAETNDHLYLSASRVRVTNLQEYLTSHKQHIVDVKIHNRATNSYKISLLHLGQLPTFHVSYQAVKNRYQFKPQKDQFSSK